MPDTLEATEFKASPVKMLLLGLGGIAMTAVSALIAFRVFYGIEPGNLIELVGYVGVGFFGLCTVLIFWRTATLRGTVVKMTPQGISDVRVAPETIPWRAIRDISTWQSQGQEIMVLDVEPQTEASLSLSRIARWTRKANKALGADGLCVVAQGISATYNDLFEAANSYWHAHRDAGAGEAAQENVGDLAAFISRFEELPVDQTVEEVVAEFSRHAFLLPLAARPTGDEDLQMLVARDNRDLTWVYIYSDEPTLARVVEEGTTYATMSFAEIFAMVEGQPGYGGIMVHAGAHEHVLPAEYFDRVRAVIGQGG